MTDFKKVFVDTAPFIYFIEKNVNNPHYYDKVKNFFMTNDKQLRQFKEIECITVDELD